MGASSRGSTECTSEPFLGPPRGAVAKWGDVQGGAPDGCARCRQPLNIDTAPALRDNPPMAAPALDLARLSRDEQYDLLDQLWEALGRDPKALPLDAAQRAELDRRLDELEAEGPVGLSWDEVVAQARSR